MVVLRCTGRVLKRFKLKPVQEPAEGTGRLGPWYANLLNVGSSRYVMCLSAPTLLPVILPARNSQFPNRFGAFLYPVLLGLGIPETAAAEEAHSTEDIVIAKTASASILGSLNDFVQCARRPIEDGLDLTDTALELAGMPMGALDYAMPDATVCKLFGVLAPRRRMLRRFGFDPPYI